MNELTNSPYKHIIAEHFEYSGDFDFLDLIARILDRVEDLHDSDDIYETIESTLIYTDDEWLVLKHYCTPADANWYKALESLESDVFSIIADINDEADA